MIPHPNAVRAADDARAEVIARLRRYMSDAVQSDDQAKRRAYSEMFTAMQDLDIREWQLARSR